jgi:uncharacterized protein
MERVSREEAELIAHQIGRPPRGEVAVARRCVHGYPQVLRVLPWVDGAPFPTLYWLSCPFLVRAVAALEAEGWVARWEHRVAEEPQLRAELDRAHAAYIAERSSLADRAEHLTAPELERQRLLSTRGIGGIADRSRLKCLHLHVAHALAGKNPIGDLVLAQLGELACEREKAICSSLGERGADRRSTDRKPDAER